MSDVIISEYYSDDKVKKAVVKQTSNSNYYVVDYYEDKNYCFTIIYPDKDLNYVEDSAETYVNGLFGKRLVPKRNI